MDFNDIIGILVMLAVIIVSVIKKKLDSDKKGGEPSKKKIPDILQDFFPDMKEMAYEDEETEEEQFEDQKPELEHIDTEKKTTASPYFSYESIDKSSMHSLIPDKKDPVYQDNLKPTQEKNEIIEDFDIRKAVIYSEILKRPDF